MAYENEAQNIVTAMKSGGLFYGRLCIPIFIIDMLLIIVCPPIYVILYQIKRSKGTIPDVEKEKFDIFPIITNMILTSCFYFPGFIHALNIKQKQCGSLFGNKPSGSFDSHGV